MRDQTKEPWVPMPLPHNQEAEEAVIGSMLLDEEAQRVAFAALESQDFHLDKPRWVFEACFALSRREEAINEITVASELEATRHLEELGGAGYLSRMVAQTPTSLHIAHYCELVKRCSQRRRLISIGSEIIKEAYDMAKPLEGIVSGMLGHMLKLNEANHTSAPEEIAVVLKRYDNEIAQWLYEGHAKMRGVPTGFIDLDRRCDGFEKGKLYILAGRPAMGKTQLMLSIARNITLNMGLPVVVFSLEQTKRALTERIIQAESGLDRHKARTEEGYITEDRQDKYERACAVIYERCPLWLDDSVALTTSQTLSKVLALKAKVPDLALVCFDYIHLAKAESGDKQVERIGQIGRGLKEIAKIADIPVLAISQLNRAVELRDNKRPQLGDLRESGDLEQVADLVMFVYRDDYYYSPEWWARVHPGEKYPKGTLEVGIAKNKDGPLGKVDVYYRIECGRIENLEKRRD